MRLIHAAASAALIAALAGPLAGCGKSAPAGSDGSGNATSGNAPVAKAAKTASPGHDQSASAEDVAKQARGDLSCPAKIASPSRTGPAPVDDVIGVRPGLTYDEAMNAVLCSHPLLTVTRETGRHFNLKAPQASTLRQGFTARAAEAQVVRSSKQIMQDLQREAMARGGNAVREDLKPGESKWFVGAMGLPGQERVLSVAREERFAIEQGPTIAGVTAALLKKYGTPSLDQPAAASRMPLLRWAYDPAGKLVAEGSPLHHRCIGTSDPDAGVTLAPDCGLVVQAMLIPQKSNPELVDRMQVGVVDQAGGYRLIGATELALGLLDQQRRSKEVEKSTKSAKGPSL